MIVPGHGAGPDAGDDQLQGGGEGLAEFGDFVRGADQAAQAGLGGQLRQAQDLAAGANVLLLAALRLAGRV